MSQQVRLAPPERGLEGMQQCRHRESETAQKTRTGMAQRVRYNRRVHGERAGPGSVGGRTAAAHTPAPARSSCTSRHTFHSECSAMGASRLRVDAYAPPNTQPSSSSGSRPSREKCTMAKSSEVAASAPQRGRYRASEGSKKPRKMSSSHTGAHTASTPNHSACVPQLEVPRICSAVPLQGRVEGVEGVCVMVGWGVGGGGHRQGQGAGGSRTWHVRAQARRESCQGSCCTQQDGTMPASCNTPGCWMSSARQAPGKCLGNEPLLRGMPSHTALAPCFASAQHPPGNRLLQREQGHHALVHPVHQGEGGGPRQHGGQPAAQRAQRRRKQAQPAGREAAQAAPQQQQRGPHHQAVQHQVAQRLGGAAAGAHARPAQQRRDERVGCKPEEHQPEHHESDGGVQRPGHGGQLPARGAAQPGEQSGWSPRRGAGSVARRLVLLGSGSRARRRLLRKLLLLLLLLLCLLLLLPGCLSHTLLAYCLGAVCICSWAVAAIGIAFSQAWCIKRGQAVRCPSMPPPAPALVSCWEGMQRASGGPACSRQPTLC